MFIRRIGFQVHLICGLLLALYVSVIGLTGTLLVFGDEVHHWEHPGASGQRKDAPLASLAVVIAGLRRRYPDIHVVSIMAPTRETPVFVTTLQMPKRIEVASDPVSGEVLSQVSRPSSKIDWIYDLHENLLTGRKGRLVNGAGAAMLLLLAATGLMNWWQGVVNWRRGLFIDLRRRWKRVNFDSHSAVGFWSVPLLAVWAISGVYFTWPEQVTAAVDSVSLRVNSRPPMITVEPSNGVLDFASMASEAHLRAPGCQLKGLIFPSSRRSPFEFLMSRTGSAWREDEDTLYFNPYNGRYITIWRYGINKSLGDLIIGLMIPLHFGTHWGMLVKMVWAFFGLSFPMLAITGGTMYWNRVLSKKWKL